MPRRKHEFKNSSGLKRFYTVWNCCSYGHFAAQISLIERGFIKPKDQEKNALADVLKMDVREIEWAEAIKTGKSKKSKETPKWADLNDFILTSLNTGLKGFCAWSRFSISYQSLKVPGGQAWNAGNIPRPWSYPKGQLCGVSLISGRWLKAFKKMLINRHIPTRE
jgi:hypothetical protein